MKALGIILIIAGGFLTWAGFTGIDLGKVVA